jgi:hypothetical protein
MSRIAAVILALAMLFGATSAWAAETRSDLASDLGLAAPQVSSALGCLDDPYYYCFAYCDDFWDTCVLGGSHSCVNFFEYDTCLDNYQVLNCCFITVRAGLL